ncbi:Hypothetical protein ORPV_349 [Orpheovirus IHUMI-LCC2]|uniref:Uncharacterized protein n=1 Tax=Orpheovirus IHUMI-LCC2 TaxID=2023057 RepID=A0A2I2L401_9VIRU|nr:Hypothetical protein ORPV_349 [Orpheovirus IHUMI-LCC2]SNW62253.1 Hypothetical protein ORPV_349 [Orpheovirus IHUMI-LCC2]
MIGQRHLLQHLLTNPKEYHNYINNIDEHFPIMDYNDAVSQDAIISLLRSQPYISPDPFSRKILISCIYNNNYNLLPYYLDNLRVDEHDSYTLTKLLSYSLYNSFDNISNLIIMHIYKWKLAGKVNSNLHVNNLCISYLGGHYTKGSSITGDDEDVEMVKKKCLNALYYLISRIPLYKDNLDEIQKIGNKELNVYAHEQFLMQGSHI